MKNLTHRQHIIGVLSYIYIYIYESDVRRYIEHNIYL